MASFLTAVMRLARDLRQHEQDTLTLKYPRRLMLVDQEDVRVLVRSMGCEAAEQIREERALVGSGGKSEQPEACDRAESDGAAVNRPATVPHERAGKGAEFKGVECAPDVAATASTLTPTAAPAHCNLRLDADLCVLPLGHGGEHMTAEGDWFDEIAF
jgi:hypothetical protein